MNDSYMDSEFSLNGWLKDNSMDLIIRHKWPDEKPSVSNNYLIRNHGGTFHTALYFIETEWNTAVWVAGPRADVITDIVDYWWDLVRVRE